MKLLVRLSSQSCSHLQQRWYNRTKDSEKNSDACEYKLQKCINFLLAAHRDCCFGAAAKERGLRYLVLGLLPPGTYFTTTLQVHQNSP